MAAQQATQGRVQAVAAKEQLRFAISAVCAASSCETTSLLIDSSNDANVCRPTFGQGFPIQPDDSGVIPRDASRNVLEINGN